MYEVSWLDGLVGVEIRSVRLLITGWNLGCLVGFFIGGFFVCLTGWLFG
jgi:hypothetical protein